MHEMQSQILWLKRGMKEDKDKGRMDRDWNDARKFVGYRLADDLIRECEKGKCDRIPPYYYSYLSAISVEEFKNMKAYFLWRERYEGEDVSDDVAREIYFEACEKIRRCKVNCLNETKKIPDALKRLLKNQHGSPSRDLMERRAFWNHAQNKERDSMRNWKVAEEITLLLYGDLLSSRQISTKIVNDYFNRTEEIPHLITMFEYSVRCPILKNGGINKKTIPNNIR